MSKLGGANRFLFFLSPRFGSTPVSVRFLAGLALIIFGLHRRGALCHECALQPAGDDAEFGLWSLETMSSDVNPARILAPAALVVQRII